MSDLDTLTLDEALRERAEALPPADFAPDRIMRRARGRQRRHRAYGALGGVAAAALVVGLAIQSGQLTSSQPLPAATSDALETTLTIDQAARANASHVWALSLPPGAPEHRKLGYEVVRRGDRVVVILPGGEAVLPASVRAVSSPTKVADGWLFIGHGVDPTGEGGVSEAGSSVIRVGADLTVQAVVEADVVASAFPSPDGLRAAVVTGMLKGDQVAYDTVRFVTLDSGLTVQVALPSDEATAAATWDGDRVAFMGEYSRIWGSRVYVYDLAERRWGTELASSVAGGNTTLRLLAAAAAPGGSTQRSLVAMERAEATCVHLMTGTTIAADELACTPSSSSGQLASPELLARVSPGGRYAVVGQAWSGRVNSGSAARVIDLTTGRDVAGIPRELLDVGAFYLTWEDGDTLIGQATRATPVHDSAALFRWDLGSSSGESLAWDPGSGPTPQTNGLSPLLWPY